jgi:tRNA pseudouridine38-40 synthase
MQENPHTNRTRNLLLRVAYDGTDFHGWQIQPGRPTIQGTLTETLAAITGPDVHLHGAGRTDAGVHAEAQAASFLLASPIPSGNLVAALNDRIPESIRVLSVEEVPESFHARRDACSKIYRYRIHRSARRGSLSALRIFVRSHPLTARRGRAILKRRSRPCGRSIRR